METTTDARACALLRPRIFKKLANFAAAFADQRQARSCRRRCRAPSCQSACSCPRRCRQRSRGAGPRPQVTKAVDGPDAAAQRLADRNPVQAAAAPSRPPGTVVRRTILAQPNRADCRVASMTRPSSVGPDPQRRPRAPGHDAIAEANALRAVDRHRETSLNPRNPIISPE